jgi:hypothetical protein
MIYTAYDIFKALEEEEQEPVYGDGWGELDEQN